MASDNNFAEEVELVLNPFQSEEDNSVCLGQSIMVSPSGEVPCNDKVVRSDNSTTETTDISGKASDDDFLDSSLSRVSESIVMGAEAFLNTFGNNSQRSKKSDRDVVERNAITPGGRNNIVISSHPPKSSLLSTSYSLEAIELNAKVANSQAKVNNHHSPISQKANKDDGGYPEMKVSAPSLVGGEASEISHLSTDSFLTVRGKRACESSRLSTDSFVTVRDDITSTTSGHVLRGEPKRPGSLRSITKDYPTPSVEEAATPAKIKLEENSICHKDGHDFHMSFLSANSFITTEETENIVSTACSELPDQHLHSAISPPPNQVSDLNLTDMFCDAVENLSSEESINIESKEIESSVHKTDDITTLDGGENKKDGITKRDENINPSSDVSVEPQGTSTGMKDATDCNSGERKQDCASPPDEIDGLQRMIDSEKEETSERNDAQKDSPPPPASRPCPTKISSVETRNNAVSAELDCVDPIEPSVGADLGTHSESEKARSWPSDDCSGVNSVGPSEISTEGGTTCASNSGEDASNLEGIERSSTEQSGNDHGVVSKASDGTATTRPAEQVNGSVDRSLEKGQLGKPQNDMKNVMASSSIIKSGKKLGESKEIGSEARGRSLRERRNRRRQKKSNVCAVTASEDYNAEISMSICDVEVSICDVELNKEKSHDCASDTAKKQICVSVEASASNPSEGNELVSQGKSAVEASPPATNSSHQEHRDQTKSNIPVIHPADPLCSQEYPSDRDGQALPRLKTSGNYPEETNLRTDSENTVTENSVLQTSNSSCSIESIEESEYETKLPSFDPSGRNSTSMVGYSEAFMHDEKLDNHTFGQSRFTGKNRIKSFIREMRPDPLLGERSSYLTARVADFVKQSVSPQTSENDLVLKEDSANSILGSRNLTGFGRLRRECSGSIASEATMNDSERSEIFLRRRLQIDENKENVFPCSKLDPPTIEPMPHLSIQPSREPPSIDPMPSLQDDPSIEPMEGGLAAQLKENMKKFEGHPSHKVVGETREDAPSPEITGAQERPDGGLAAQLKENMKKSAGNPLPKAGEKVHAVLPVKPKLNGSKNLKESLNSDVSSSIARLRNSQKGPVDNSGMDPDGYRSDGSSDSGSSWDSEDDIESEVHSRNNFRRNSNKNGRQNVLDISMETQDISFDSVASEHSIAGMVANMLNSVCDFYEEEDHFSETADFRSMLGSVMAAGRAEGIYGRKKMKKEQNQRPLDEVKTYKPPRTKHNKGEKNPKKSVSFLNITSKDEAKTDDDRTKGSKFLSNLVSMDDFEQFFSDVQSDFLAQGDALGLSLLNGILCSADPSEERSAFLNPGREKSDDIHFAQSGEDNDYTDEEFDEEEKSLSVVDSDFVDPTEQSISIHDSEFGALEFTHSDISDQKAKDLSSKKEDNSFNGIVQKLRERRQGVQNSLASPRTGASPDSKLYAKGEKPTAFRSGGDVKLSELKSKAPRIYSMFRSKISKDLVAKETSATKKTGAGAKSNLSEDSGNSCQETSDNGSDEVYSMPFDNSEESQDVLVDQPNPTSESKSILAAANELRKSRRRKKADAAVKRTASKSSEQSGILGWEMFDESPFHNAPLHTISEEDSGADIDHGSRDAEDWGSGNFLDSLAVDEQRPGPSVEAWSFDDKPSTHDPINEESSVRTPGSTEAWSFDNKPPVLDPIIEEPFAQDPTIEAWSFENKPSIPDPIIEEKSTLTRRVKAPSSENRHSKSGSDVEPWSSENFLDSLASGQSLSMSFDSATNFFDGFALKSENVKKNDLQPHNILQELVPSDKKEQQNVEERAELSVHSHVSHASADRHSYVSHASADRHSHASRASGDTGRQGLQGANNLDSRLTSSFHKSAQFGEFSDWGKLEEWSPTTFVDWDLPDSESASVTSAAYFGQ